MKLFPTDIELWHISTDEFTRQKAYEILFQVDESIPQTNMRFAIQKEIPIEDVREKGLKHFTLYQHGFQFMQHHFQQPLSLSVVQDDDRGQLAVTMFLTELRGILLDELKADHVVIYDWRLRSHAPEKSRSPQQPCSDRTLALPPASFVHADESAACGLKVVSEHATKDEIHTVLSDQWRVRIINIWRPLVSQVSDNPLALCDWSSVNSDDWELCDQIHQDRCDEAMYLKHRSHHKWYWMSNQHDYELSLFTVWDSQKSKHNTQSSVPHASFHIPNETALRESIEVRSIVWTKV